MNLYEAWTRGQPLSDFMASHGSPAHAARWQATFDEVQLTADQRATLAKFVRKLPVLVLAGTWCGDCASQCPIFERFAEASPLLELRYLDNHTEAAVQAALKVNGGNRVPVVVFFSEDGHEIGRYGDRTLAKYRQMVEQQAGIGCATGINTPGDPLLARVVAEWLNEFERAQWIARLSPRLRQLHGD